MSGTLTMAGVEALLKKYKDDALQDTLSSMSKQGQIAYDTAVARNLKDLLGTIKQGIM